MTDFITGILAKLFDSFKAKNPKIAALILLLLGVFYYALNNGLSELIGTDLSKYGEYLVLILAALQGSRTTNILNDAKKE